MSCKYIQLTGSSMPVCVIEVRFVCLFRSFEIHFACVLFRLALVCVGQNIFTLKLYIDRERLKDIFVHWSWMCEYINHTIAEHGAAAIYQGTDMGTVSGNIYLEISWRLPDDDVNDDPEEEKRSYCTNNEWLINSIAASVCVCQWFKPIIGQRTHHRILGFNRMTNLSLS